MVDIHTHVLPGLDDGAANAETSIAIARQAAAAGVHTLVATPHIRSDYDVRPGELAERTAELAAELRRHELDIAVLPGGEVAVPTVAELDDEDLRFVSLAGRGRYVLLETPYGPVPPAFEEAAFALQVRGMTAVIAHPERSRSLRSAPARLAGLVERGALVQLTATSLTGALGRDTGRFAHALVDGGLAHVLASDVHKPEERTRSLADARDVLARRGLTELAQWLCDCVPSALVLGIEPPPRPARRRRGPVARLWRRTPGE